MAEIYLGMSGMSVECALGIVVRIFKEKGNVTNCSCY